MATCRIDPVRVELLRILISCEPAILSKISFQDGSGRKTGKKLQVREDGTVIFYCGKGPLWWQRCCNDYELVSIVDVALRVADVITGSHGTRNELAFDGITKSILDEAKALQVTTNQQYRVEDINNKAGEIVQNKYPITKQLNYPRGTAENTLVSSDTTVKQMYDWIDNVRAKSDLAINNGLTVEDFVNSLNN